MIPETAFLAELAVTIGIVALVLFWQHFAAAGWPWSRYFGWMAVAPASYVVGVATLGCGFSFLMYRWGDVRAIWAFWGIAASGLMTMLAHAIEALLRRTMRHNIERGIERLETGEDGEDK